jgi:hypothetical protein
MGDRLGTLGAVGFKIFLAKFPIFVHDLSRCAAQNI